MKDLKDFVFSAKNGMAVIEKYTGAESFVVIPEKIENLPVVEVKSEAFRGYKQLVGISFPESLAAVGEYAFCECRGLKEAVFGKNLNFAGSHAFYNCRSLEKIKIPSGLEYIGDGFVKNCDSLNSIIITSDKSISSSVSGFLSEISGEFSLEIEDSKTRLLFPSFGYEYIDKCYSKTFETVTHGAGVMYRRCIEKNSINYSLYDYAFKYASGEELSSTVCRIAINRLMNPFGMEKDALINYRAYLSANISAALRAAVETGDIDSVEALEGSGVFDSENIGEALKALSELERPDFTAAVMDIKMRRFGRVKKSFDI